MGEADPLGVQALPRVLELTASEAADSTAFDHSGALPSTRPSSTSWPTSSTAPRSDTWALRSL
eukprot:scaffold73987_cov70-Phaeocystis_antarctica.AAC.3